MTAVHDYEEMHHLVDQLSAAEVRRLRTLVADDPQLSKYAEKSPTTESEENAEGRKRVRRLSTAGLGGSGRRDLSERVEDLLAKRFDQSE